MCRSDVEAMYIAGDVKSFNREQQTSHPAAIFGKHHAVMVCDGL